MAQRSPEQLFALAKRTYGSLSVLAPERLRVMDQNIRTCFPDMPQQERLRLLDVNTFETWLGFLWLMALTAEKTSQPDTRHRVEVKGLHHLQNGGVLLTSHSAFTHVALMALALKHPLVAFERPEITKDKYVNATMLEARKRFYADCLPRDDIRSALRAIKKGGTLLFAPDQSYKVDRVVYADFLGAHTNTITTPATLAKISRARLFTCWYTRVETGFSFEIAPLFEDAKQDQDPFLYVQAVNKWLEQKITAMPEQYLWAHKRFKLPFCGVKRDRW